MFSDERSERLEYKFMVRIAHLGDTHIRNFDRQDQYRTCFADLYAKLRFHKVDYIVHAGDIAHSKTTLSPEYFDLCSEFIRNLGEVAPVYIILGNHDGNLRNLSRQDAISPVVSSLNMKNVHLLKDSGECQVDDKVTLNVLSVFDEDNWIPPSDQNKINIALYHGGVRGSQTDTGWNIKIDHGIEIFDGFDFAMLGDIHKSNQILDADGRVRYCGSTIQQNHGETPDKGFLLWDIEDADNFNVEHIMLEDPSPHLDIRLTKSGRLPRNLEVPENAIVRVVSGAKTSSSNQRRVKDIVRKKYNPKKVTFINKDYFICDGAGLVVKNVDIGNLRNIGVQNKMITEFLQDYTLDKSAIEEILLLNRKYNDLCEDDKLILRNINWSLESLEWDNLFNYGTENKIDFDSMNGIVGIFGKNFSGKSSVIDALLFTLTNSTSKSSVKNVNLINQNKRDSVSRLSIGLDGKKFHITRKMEKFEKNKKSDSPNTEARMELDFWSEDSDTGEITSLNGETRTLTDANIRKYMGSKEDFMMTSFCSQLDSLQFINCGSTDRKKILSKFLDLELFENKFRAAKEDATQITGAYKNIEGKDYTSEIQREMTKLETALSSLSAQKSRCDILKESQSAIRKSAAEIDVKIASYPKIDINIDKIKEGIEDKKSVLQEVISSLAQTDAAIEERKTWISKANEYIESVPLEGLTLERDTHVEKKAELSLLLSESEKLDLQKNNLDKKISLLSKVPCGDKFPKCQFLQDAVASKGEIRSVADSLLNIGKKSKKLEDSIDEKALSDAEMKIEKYRKLLERRSGYQNDLTNCELEQSRTSYEKMEIERDLEILGLKKKEYHENEKDCKIISELTSQKASMEEELVKISEEIESCEEQTHLFIQTKGSCEQIIQNLEDRISEREELRKQSIAYEHFASCMGAHGISSEIIKKCLPVINEEIGKILVGIAPFEVFIELEDKKLEIYIKHPKYEPRLVEMASGAEKTLASMAIRLALTKIGTLPKSDIFILDEPATDLDVENMEGFIRLLEMLKSQFKTVILISHLDMLKECIDSEIVIDKKSGFAHIDV